jgi:2-polyprenyl-3-methyl-5-hydroxy-6-metoxy-1,4-benzoquinol methylase
MSESTKLEEHYQKWFKNIDRDFRANNLNKIIIKLLQKPQTILDFGCGSGALSACLLAAGKTVVSRDVSENMLKMSEKYLKSKNISNYKLQLGDLSQLNDSEKYEAIVALDVLEHIENDREAVHKLKNLLTDNGLLVLSVPAIPWLYGPKDRDVGHYRRYDKKRLTALLEDAGFVIQSLRYWNLLGVLPVWWSIKRNKKVDESFRYNDKEKLINKFLKFWFSAFENNVCSPLGLTLICVAQTYPLPDK